MGKLIKSTDLCLELKDKIKNKIKSSGIRPGLKIYCLNEDPASQIYVGSKKKACEQVGVNCEVIQINPNFNLKKALEDDANNPEVHGILVQKPTIKNFDDSWVPPHKDVDGFHPLNAGKLFLGDPNAICPCTPKGVVYWLKQLTNLKGKYAVVMGRSSIVGRPLASALINEDVAVSTLHHGTSDALNASIASQADLLIIAIGKAEFVDEKFIKPGAIVIDVGINRRADGKVVGDVKRSDEVLEKVSLLSAVPGGVGPLTVTMVLWNICELAGIKL